MSKPPRIAFLMATVVCLATISIAADDNSSKFSVTTKRSDDKVEIETDNEKAMFTIRSPFGISSAGIERVEAKWPDAVIMRLHLKGLENLRLSNGNVILEVSVSSHGENPQVRQRNDKNEDMPLNESSPYWMGIRMVGGDGKPAKGIPLNDGYFEIKLPKALFDDNPNSITINWIDFYRR